MAINTVVFYLSVVPIATALVASIADVAHAAVVPPCACQTAVEMSSTVDLKWTPDDVRRFRHEAERAWTALGVDVCWRDARTPCDHARVTLYVRVAEDVPSAEPSARGALGWIGFSDVSGPGTFIVLSVRRAIELLGRAERAARRLAELPGMVERLLPRALGRALAHELGHYLLARRAHSPAGLMREAFRPEDLADDGEGQRMQLSAGDTRALAQRCVPRPVGLTADASATTAPPQ
jgi:hypothetical protein